MGLLDVLDTLQGASEFKAQLKAATTSDSVLVEKAFIRTVAEEKMRVNWPRLLKTLFTFVILFTIFLIFAIQTGGNVVLNFMLVMVVVIPTIQALFGWNRRRLAKLTHLKSEALRTEGIERAGYIVDVRPCNIYPGFEYARISVQFEDGTERVIRSQSIVKVPVINFNNNERYWVDTYFDRNKESHVLTDFSDIYIETVKSSVVTDDKGSIEIVTPITPDGMLSAPVATLKAERPEYTPPKHVNVQLYPDAEKQTQAGVFSFVGFFLAVFGLVFAAVGTAFVVQGELFAFGHLSIGVVLLVVGTRMCVKEIGLAQQIKNAATSDSLMIAQVIGVREVASKSVNDQHPEVGIVLYTHPVTGETIEARTQEVGHVPFTEFRVGKRHYIKGIPEKNDPGLFLSSFAGMWSETDEPM